MLKTLKIMFFDPEHGWIETDWDEKDDLSKDKFSENQPQEPLIIKN